MSEKESNYFVIVLIIGLSIGLPILFYFLYVIQVLPAVMLNVIIAIITVIAILVLVSAFRDITVSKHQGFSKEFSSYYNNGEFDKAIDVCKAALEKDPNNITILNDLDSAYVASNQYEKSIEIDKRLLNLSPENAGTWWYNLGNTYYRKGDYDKALESLDRALEIDSKDTLTIQFREKILKEKGN